MTIKLFYYCLRNYLILSILCLLGLNSTLLGQSKGNSNYNVKLNGIEKSVKSLDSAGVKYINLSDFAEKFDIIYETETKKKIDELEFKSFVIRFSSGNTFLEVIDKKSKTAEIISIGKKILYSKNSCWIPAKSSIPLIEKYADKSNKEETKNKSDKKGNKEDSDDDGKKDVEHKNPESPDIKESQKEQPKGKFSNYVKNVDVDSKANGTVVTISFTEEVPKVSHKINGKTIIIKFYSTDVAKSFERIMKTGLVRKIETKAFDGGNTFEITLSEEYSSYEVMQNKGKDEVIVNIFGKNEKKTGSNEKQEKGDKKRWIFDTIVLDAGHGGHDAGAVGYKGLREKDVNLNVALKLGQLIKENIKGLNVVYTRSGDNFVELDKRGKIANEKSGKLFISIHCNSVPDKDPSASGFEVYLLRPGKTEDAIKIAERENGVIKYEKNPDKYQKLTEENFILVSMAHSTYMHYSEKFAEVVNTNMSANLPIKSRGVKQAGFYVLVGASMPSVLVEIGFVTGSQDSKLLGTADGQQKIALSLYQAIKSYKQFYEEAMEREN